MMFGQSTIEVRVGVHSFLAGDGFHLDSQKIHDLLTKLEMQMVKEVYIPNLDFLLRDIEAIL